LSTEISNQGGHLLATTRYHVLSTIQAPTTQSEGGKVALKSNSDEALSNESLLKSHEDEALSDNPL
jgi:hypothetical protein